MAKNQTFSVSLNLLTKNFQKGVKSIQTSLNKLKMQFMSFAATLGTGIGLSEIAKKAIDVSKKLDKAQTTLKNVSGGVEAYANNQKFVMDMSKKYNQELTVLMDNYAKFHSSANMTGMALQQQQYIFEALTKAAAYYNLSAEDTNGVMLAVNQMISKGKVSTEELRKQLGERLPGAMNLAAKAMGVTAGELDEMIRKGEVMAEDLLPKLAKELNAFTGNVNVDTVQGAIGRLQNSFTSLVSKLNINKVYKNIINGVANGLDYIGDNLKEVGQKIAILIGTLAGRPIAQKIHNTWEGVFNSLQKDIDLTHKKMEGLRDVANIKANTYGIKIDQTTLQPMGRIPVDPKASQAFTELKINADKFAETQKHLIEQQDAFNNKLSTMGKKLGTKLKSVLKFIGIQAIYAGIAMLISTIVTKLVSWYKEQQRIKNLVRDTRAEFEKTSKTLGADEVELEQLQKALNVENDRARAIARINQLLGLQGKSMFNLESSNDDINAALAERIKLLREEREYQAAKQILTDAQNRKTELEAQNQALAAADAGNLGKEIGKVAGKGSLGVQILTGLFVDKKLEQQYKNNANEIEQLNKVIEEFSAKVTGYSLSAPNRDAVLNGGGSTVDLNTDLAEDYKKIQDEYNENLRTLNEKKKHSLITEEEYKKELEDLTLKTAEAILALNDIDENTDVFAKGILDAAKAYIANAKKEDKIKEELDKYYKSVQELYHQYNNGTITHKELEDEMYNLLQETAHAVSAMGDLSGAAEKLAQSYNKQKTQKTLDAIGKETAPEMGKFDSTLAYKMSASEMYQENADYIKDYTSNLKTYIETLKTYKDELSGDELKQLNGYISELETNLGTLTSKADSFAQAAKFAEIQEDVKDLKSQLAQGIWDNISGIAMAAERLTNSWKSLTETMEDPDATGWEKFLTIFTTLISTIETLVGIYQAVNTAMEIAQALSLAKTAADQASIPVELEKIGVLAAQTAVAKELAVAQHMASAAAVPYPANLAAIASTSAALAAAFAAVPAFAQGGIVDSPSTIGDRNLIRVNGGEAILTKSQQGTLWKLLDGQTSAMSKGTAQVEFKIKGSELVGVINNYSKKISK